jgi:hypothetical protein
MRQEKDNVKFTTDQAKRQLADSSKALAHLTANMVYDEPSLFSVLVDVALAGEAQYAQRASRIVCICSSRFPELFQPHCSRVIRGLKNNHSEGAIRNFLKIIAEVPLKLTNRDKSTLINVCFDFLESGKYPVAILVFSMEVLFNLSREIPEIGEELFRILEDQLPGASAGYRSRARRILEKGKN